MEQNKIRSYFLYAFGEVLLVVIGILIALQVNNWNTQRLEKQEEQQILINLKSEFLKAEEQLIYLNTLRDDFLSATTQIIEVSNSTHPYDEHYLDSLLVMTMYNPTFNDPTGSLNTLFSSGKINLVTSNKLKTQLMAWPSEAVDMTEDEARQMILTENEYRPVLIKHISIANIFKYFEISDITFNRNAVTLEGTLPSENLKSDYQTLLSSHEFINSLQLRAVFMNISRVETHILIEKAVGIIALIDQELSTM